jgi:hypothetical protein
MFSPAVLFRTHPRLSLTHTFSLCSEEYCTYARGIFSRPLSSFGDPGPYVFGPPGSRSISQKVVRRAEIILAK